MLNENGGIVEGHADLAVILLDDALDTPEPGFPPPRGDVQEGEFLTMVGYGHDTQVGGVYGARYFRRNRAMGAAARSDGFVYEQGGATAYQGFSGGPCLRENQGRQWLMGVARVRSGQRLPCTSTGFY